MDAQSKRTTSMISAGALAALTLSVFFVSLNKGPASAVTRFHEALRRSDYRLIREVTGGDLNSPAAGALFQHVASLLGPGSWFQVTRIEKIDTEAKVFVVYHSPQYNLSSVPFFLRKVGTSWLIDPQATLVQIARQRGG